MNEPASKQWATVNLDEICDIVRGLAFPSTDKQFAPKDGLIACLRTANVQREVDWTDIWFIPRKHLRNEDQLVRLGDILISTANSYELVGKVAQVKELPFESTLGAFISLLRPTALVDGKFVFYQVASSEVQTAIRAMASTTTNISNVSTGKLRGLKLRLAPRIEQTAIVAEIEKQFTRLDAATAALKRVQANLKRYRASVVKAACEGRLVPTEAELARKEGRDYEPADKLLQRILHERRARWAGESLVTSDIDQRSVGVRTKYRTYKEPRIPDVVGLPILPEGWCWATIEQLMREPLRNGHSSPASKDGHGVRTLTLSAVTEGDFSERNTKVTIADPAKVANLWLVSGDLLIERSNAPELVGTARVFRGEGNYSIFPDLLIRVRLVPEVSVSYIEMWLQSETARSFFRCAAQGISGSMPKIDQSTIERATIPIPPYNEQIRICKALDELLGGARRVGSSLRLQMKHSEVLRYSVLSHAFCGRLVDQNPADEPAADLLNRIRAQRASSTNGKANRRGRALATTR